METKGSIHCRNEFMIEKCKRISTKKRMRWWGRAFYRSSSQIGKKLWQDLISYGRDTKVQASLNENDKILQSYYDNEVEMIWHKACEIAVEDLCFDCTAQILQCCFVQYNRNRRRFPVSLQGKVKAEKEVNSFWGNWKWRFDKRFEKVGV